MKFLTQLYAPPQHYVAARPDVPHGTLTATSFRSAILGNERRVWIYTPPSYRSDGAPYPLALFADGWFYHTVAPTILDNLRAEGRIPGLVAVFIDNTRADRWHELRFRHGAVADRLVLVGARRRH